MEELIREIESKKSFNSGETFNVYKICSQLIIEDEQKAQKVLVNVLNNRSKFDSVHNPILSDFGSMSGVNTRPRDNIHQGIDIIGQKNQSIIAIADGKVLETTIEDCWGATLIVDHGKALDGKNLITIYGHVGEFMVKENDNVKRGDIIAKLPEKVNYRCMARVRHLHLKIGQRYCKKEEKDNWGCKYFIKDFYSSLNPHNYWSNGPKKISCFEKNKEFKKGTITFPFTCKRIK